MIDIENIIDEVYKNLNLDRETVSIVCKHVFKDTVDIMKSDDTKDILKTRFKNNKKQQYR